MPQEVSDYGDFEEGDEVKDGDAGDDPIGDLLGQVFDGFGKLFEEGVDLITDLANGEVCLNF